MTFHNDTIAAVATPHGSGGISVIKLSGPRSLAVLLAVLRSHRSPELHPREMIHGKITLDHRVIDEALVCYMPGPRSYTGDDVVEIQTHGGTAASSAVLDLLLTHGIRPAEPGEFTLRAFLNGKIDLIQAESIRLITEAESAAALSGAEKLLAGALSRTVEGIVDALVTVAAGIEARIEFGDEQGLPSDAPNFSGAIGEQIVRIDTLLRSFAGSRKTLNGFRTVITGEVNVGKSSLFNALLGKKRAIVTPRPGTTRDWIEARLEIGGTLFTLVDTAGIRETGDEIEREGVEEARRLVGEADIVIHILAPEIPLPEIPETSKEKTIFVRGKADLSPDCASRGVIPVSPVTGAGLDSLIEALVSLAKASVPGTGSTGLLLERHWFHLETARDALLRASDTETPEECILLDLNVAIGEFNSLLGKNVSPDILDTVFRSFCIGK